MTCESVHNLYTAVTFRSCYGEMLHGHNKLNNVPKHRREKEIYKLRIFLRAIKFLRITHFLTYAEEIKQPYYIAH